MNVFSEEFLAAFELLEGVAALQNKGEYSLEEVQRLFHERDEDEEARPDSPTGLILYGAGGWHRYYVLCSGEVVFSRHHSIPERQRDAADLGFRLW